jgi:NAD+ kinase
MSARRRLGLIANVSKGSAKDLLAAMRREFSRHDVELMFDRDTAALAGLQSAHTMRDLADLCDLLVVLGGDGTMLQVFAAIDGRIPPTFGINLGTLGFLTCLGAASSALAAEVIVRQQYVLSERTLLTVELRRGVEVLAKYRALNDAVVSRGEQSRLIKLDVRIDGDSLTKYNADGLIIATPTGSTAYSLAAGGPVLSPDSGVFVITPICPHVLTNRSVIVADHSRIEITPAQSESVFLTLDGGDVVRVEPHDTLIITKSPFRLPLAMIPEMTFFEVLRQKLKWSGTAI